MDADLMRPPRLQAAAQVRVAAVAGNDLPMGHGAAAVFLCDRHALAVGRVSSYGGVDRSAVLTKAAAHDTLIGAAEGMVLKLCGEALVGKVVLRHDQKSACVHVDTVDDARALLAVNAGERVAAVVQQGVDERPVLVTGGRMHDQSLRLVHDQHVRVLVNNVQRDVLCDQCGRLDLRKRQRVDVARSGFCVFFHGPSVAGDQSLLQQPLHGASRQLRHRLREKEIDPLPRLLSRQCHLRYPCAASFCRPRSGRRGPAPHSRR